MKNLALFGLLFLFLSFSVIAENSRKNKKTKKIQNLTEEISFKLDSILQTQAYETIQGREYYRFQNGVLTAFPDSISGAFILTDSISEVFILTHRIYFTSHNGEITFSCIDETGRVYRETLEQFLFALQGRW